DASRGPDVRALALADPRLHLRRALELPVRARPGGTDVHAHHLAPGRMAARARLQLRLDAPLGGDPDAAADHRVPARRPDGRHPLGQVRPAPLPAELRLAPPSP